MMLTRCPGCTTTFRVTPEQVKVRHGKVRCGRCQHVFDAIEYLVEAPPPAEAAVPDTSVEPAPETPATPIAGAMALEAAAEVKAEADPAPEIEPGATAEALEPADAAAAPPPGRAELDSVLLQPLPPQASPLSEGYLRATERRMPQWPWAAGAALALVALAAQILLAFRVDIAAQQPDMQPLLESLCVYTSCSVELPSDPTKLTIEVSDLHPAAKEGKGQLELTATLKNHAPNPQAWPYLELTLTDGADKPIVRKVIPPALFAPAGAAGFAANTELPVQLALDAGDLPAAGYRLYLFYP